MNFLKFSLISLLIISLMSCVVESTKPSMQGEISKIENIEIDSDIEDDFNMALSYLKSEKYDEAIQLLKELIAKEQRVPAPFVNLGMAYDKKGEHDNAEKYFLLALGVDLTHPVANNQLGMLYRKKGKFNKSKKAYTNALTAHPDYLPLVKNYGILCELYLRDLPCALQQYEHYLSLQPESKTMKIWVADLSNRIKR